MPDDPIAAQYAVISAKDRDAARRAVAPEWVNREAEREAPQHVKEARLDSPSPVRGCGSRSRTSRSRNSTVWQRAT